jgi:hypothetical protein
MTSTIRTAAIALISGLLLAGSLFAGTAGGLQGASEPAAVAAPPQPSATYISELGAASVQPPRQAPAPLLPASGSAVDPAGLPWSKLAGLGLAVCGALLVHAALAMRPRDAAHS